MPGILVIDDEQIILDNIKFVLELEDYEVLTTSNAEDGIDIFVNNHQNIDVVITDMRMPKITGLEVLKSIIDAAPEISVIILTGHGDMKNAIEALKNGAFDYLMKPVNADELIISINNAVNRKKLILENIRMQNEIIEQNNYLKGLQDSAQKILLNMLPKQYPSTSGFKFTSMYKSCDTVGGDMFDIYDADDYMVFYVSDVTSHGILASLIAIIIKSFMQNVIYTQKLGIKIDFSKMISDLNNELCINTAQNIFATMFIGFIEKASNKLYYISAGHIDQYVCSKEGITFLNSTGVVLGAFEDVDFSTNVYELNKGDKILLFTDGIPEAVNDQQLFGCDRILDSITKSSSLPIDMIVKDLFDNVLCFSKGAIFDDMTILGIELIE